MMNNNARILAATKFDNTMTEKVNAFLKPCGLAIAGASYTQYDNGDTIYCIGIDRKGKATYSGKLGEMLKEAFGFKCLILDGVEV